MKRSINITRLSWKWTILLLVGFFVAMYGYSQNAGAGFNTLVDPPGACLIPDDPDFNTEDGGCKDLATGIVWSADSYPAFWTWDYAVIYCDNLDEGGYTDWVLPTKDELIEVALNGAAGNLAVVTPGAHYHSRTNVGKNLEWVVRLTDGHAAKVPKTSVSSGLCNRHPATGGSGAPSDLIATAVSTDQIDLTWIDKSADEDGFEIERSLDGVNWPSEPIDTVGANVSNYSDDEGLTKKTTYYYRVRAYGPAGYSDYSNTASAKTKNR